MDALVHTTLATLFTFGMTALGAAVVFFTKKMPSELFTKLSLGFAAGIMISASMWSLLAPAIEQVEKSGASPVLPVAGGFVLGAIFLSVMDKILPHMHLSSTETEGPHTRLGRNQLLFLAVTLHNIPEGMAVGIAFAAAAAVGEPEAYSGAIALTIGMGLQNFPEGTALSLPLNACGMSRFKAFVFGSMSAIVAPIAAIIVVSLAAYFIPVMPWLLSFAAGAMIYVVVEELIPEAKLGEHSDLGTIAVITGFVVMMVLDTALG